MRWRDISVWQPGERRDEPNRISIEGTALRITIQKGLRNHCWWMQGHGLDFNFPLKAKTLEQAKLEAIGLVQERLERMVSELNEMKSA